MIDRYESVVLLGNGIQPNIKALSKQLEKTFQSNSSAPVISTEGTEISLSYPDFSFTLSLITDNSLVEERRVMAHYFGTERGDLDKIAKVQSYFEITSKGADPNMEYFNDYTKIIGTLESLGQTWSLNPNGFLA